MVIINFICFFIYIIRNKLKNIDILKVEFSPDFRSLVNAWNMTVAQWLHRDVFSRTLLTYGPQKSNLLTYFVSAFWHGMYPFYYVVFISGSFISITEKKIWKKYSLRYAVFREMPLWFRIGKIVLTQALLQYLTLAFLILEWDRAWIFWKSLYFYGHILVFILFFFF